MNLPYKIIGSSLILMVVACGTFFIGGVTGFQKGYFYASAFDVPSEAFTIVEVIRRIKERNTEGALRLLESQLDSNIIEHWMVFNAGRSIFDIHSYADTRATYRKTSMGLMSEVAQYRKNNPTTHDKDVQEFIEEAIRYYSSADTEMN